MTEQEKERLISAEKDVGLLKVAFGKMDEMAKSMHEMSINVALLVEQVKQSTDKYSDIDGRLTKHGERIGALENKPGKKWENMSGTIMNAVTIAVLGIILAMVGLK